MKTFWIFVSALCGAAAVFFIFRNDYDKTFIAAALGGAAWFLGYRARLRETFGRDDTETEIEDETEVEDEADT